MRAIVVTFYGRLDYGSMLRATVLRRATDRLGYDVSFFKQLRMLPFFLHHSSLLV